MLSIIGFSSKKYMGKTDGWEIEAVSIDLQK